MKTILRHLATATLTLALPLAALAQSADGEVRKIDLAQGKITLKHGDIKSLDMPPIETHIVEVPVSSGPYGAKGVGEPASIPTAPAILNAISDAIRIRVTRIPATPENILRLIREKERR